MSKERIGELIREYYKIVQNTDYIDLYDRSVLFGVVNWLFENGKILLPPSIPEPQPVEKRLDALEKKYNFLYSEVEVNHTEFLHNLDHTAKETSQRLDTLEKKVEPLIERIEFTLQKVKDLEDLTEKRSGRAFKRSNDLEKRLDGLSETLEVHETSIDRVDNHEQDIAIIKHYCNGFGPKLLEVEMKIDALEKKVEEISKGFDEQVISAFETMIDGLRERL